MEISYIKTKVEQGKYEISLHAEKERYAEGVLIEDIEEAILSGEILEDYTGDPRGPSCLILGFSGGRPVHIVCGITTTEWIRIITVYRPQLPKWIDERTRKG